VFAAAVAAPGARAQDTSVKSLIDRVDRLQREITTLQRQVYRGETPPTAAGSAGDGGDVSDTQAARIQVRLSQFEGELRRLTGQVEEQSFKINQMAQRLDKLVADMDLRLQRLEQGGTAAADGSKAAGNELAAAPALGNAGDPLPEGTPEERYRYATDLLSKQNFSEAERALSAFLKQHPKDKLAGNAKYWLGETYYVRGRYTDAAVAFAEGYEAYPKSSKAPDNLLKLGKSLAALDKKSDACGVFAELRKRYSKAAPTILQQAKREQKRLSCK
jgi:tol-pal system protein YbgF